jgi:hypothetical protein
MQEAGGEQQGHTVLFLQVHARVMETVVQLDIYRAHVFSEAGEVKPYLRHLIHRMVALALSGAEAAGGGGGGAEGESKGQGNAAMSQVGQEGGFLEEQALLQAATYMLLIDHTAAEPHAHNLTALAVKSLRCASASGAGVHLAAVAAEGAGGDVRDAAEGFLSGFLRTMSRLNQGEKFVECFLAALRVHALPPTDPMLDPTLLAFSANLQDAKWGQLPALWEQALSELTTHHLPSVLRLRKIEFLQGGEGGGGQGVTGKPVKKDKGRGKSGVGKEGREGVEGWEGVDGAEAMRALQALVHVSQFMAVMLKAALGKALGPDSAALQQLCLRTSSQVMGPLLTTCIKSLQDKTPSRSTRVWCTHAGASLLTLHAALAQLASSFSPSAGANTLKDLTQWPATSMSLIKFLAALEGMAEGGVGEGNDGEGVVGKEWCTFGLCSPLAVAMAVAATQELVFHDTHLSVPLGGTATEEMLDKVSDGTQLAQMMMLQFNASLTRLCRAGSGERRWATQAAAGVCRVAFARLPLVSSFCCDDGLSSRCMWRTLLSAAAALRAECDGSESQVLRHSLAVSPYAERVYELLCHPAGQTRSGGGLYDIPAVHVEFVSALVELLVEGGEAVLREKGRDILEACNGHGEDGVAWGSRALVALKHAVRKRGKQRQGRGHSDAQDKAKKERNEKEKKEKKEKEKQEKKEKKRKTHASDIESDSNGDEHGEGGGLGEESGVAPVMEEKAWYGTCARMWLVHPGAYQIGAVDVSPVNSKKENGKKEKKEKGSEREGKGAAAGVGAAVAQLNALLQCVRKIPPDMLTMQCKQVGTVWRSSKEQEAGSRE